MSPLEMIREWERGCTVSMFSSDSKQPIECQECTAALIAALKNKLMDDEDNARPILPLKYIWTSGLLVGIPIGSVLGWLASFLWLAIAGWAMYRIWRVNQ